MRVQALEHYRHDLMLHAILAPHLTEHDRARTRPRAPAILEEADGDA